MKYVTGYVASLAVAVLLFGGCESSGPESHGKAVDSGTVRSEATSNQWIELTQPTVEIDGNSVTVSGSVHRKAGVAAALSGRIDIEFVDTDGEVLQSLPAKLNPSKLSTDPAVPSTYHTEFDWAPPQGSTVRVHFVDSKTAQREDLEAGRMNNMGGGKH